MEVASASAANAASSVASSRLSANFDTFLTLLTTQLRNQDPLEPLDTEKFTEQLVQFASVEQSIATNKHLEALIALQNSSANETALAMVGRFASIDTDVATLGDTPARWSYSLPQDAVSATVRIHDASGALVHEENAAATTGVHQIAWDGRLENGARSANGAYRLSVEATSADGDMIEANISARGQVDAATFGNGEPAIEIGGKLYPLALVRRIDEDA